MTNSENKNALKHGAFSEIVILSEEDPNELQQLLTELREEWNPDGATEINKVNSIAMGIWRKRRFKRYLQKSIAKFEAVERAIDRREEKDFERLMSILEDIESGIVTEDYISKKLDPGEAKRIREKHPRNKYDSDRAWLGAVSKEIIAALNQHILNMDKFETVDDDVSVEVFAEREQSFEERVDAKIDRDIKSLGQIKTMKAIGIGKPRPSKTTEPLKKIETPQTPQ